ncbi:MAG: hypothetical protein Q4A82_02235 [Corynebacterium sp.]|nr:hypothetical protein [Corynebacterium sp.]
MAGVLWGPLVGVHVGSAYHVMDFCLDHSGTIGHNGGFVGVVAGVGAVVYYIVFGEYLCVYAAGF